MTDNLPQTQGYPAHKPMDREVFLRTVRTFRKAKTIVVLVIVAILTACLWRRCLLPMPPGDTTNKNLIYLGAWLCTFMFATGLRKVVTGESEVGQISTEGGLFMGTERSWADVTSVKTSRGSFSSRRRFIIMFSRHPRIAVLENDQLVSKAEADACIARLAAWLQEYHPHVKVE